MSSSPTIAQIAKTAGVSEATASRALRNNPAIAKATRLRVQALARELGYVPDPELSKAMAVMRRARSSRYQGTLAIIIDELPPVADPYARAVIAGAIARAGEVGYKVDTISRRDPGITPRRLSGILRNRGITGVLVAPLAFGNVEVPLDWENFAGVAMTYTLQVPQLDRVVPHHFSNMVKLYGHLQSRGYRRLGLLARPQFEWRNFNAPTAALHWFYRHQGITDYPEPCSEHPHGPGFLPWVERERPDVIVGSNFAAITANTPLRIPRDIAFACYGNLKGDETGVDQRPAAVGAAAVDRLTTCLLHNTYGIPEMTSTLMIEGRVVEGTTAPARPGAIGT